MSCSSLSRHRQRSAGHQDCEGKTVKQAAFVSACCFSCVQTRIRNNKSVSLCSSARPAVHFFTWVLSPHNLNCSAQQPRAVYQEVMNNKLLDDADLCTFNFTLQIVSKWDYKLTVRDHDLFVINKSDNCASPQLEAPPLASAGALRLLGVWAAQRSSFWLVCLHRCAAHLLHLPCLFHWWGHGSSASRATEAGFRPEGGGARNSLLKPGLFQVRVAATD